MRGRRCLPLMHMVGLGLLPFALMFGSWMPFWWFALELARALNIPMDEPLKEQRFGLLCLVLFLFTGVCFMLVGAWLGLYLVVATLRLGYGWTWADVLGSMFAPHRFESAMWGLKDLTLDSEDTDWSADPMYDDLLDEDSDDSRW